MSKKRKWSWKKILLILGGCFLLAIIIGIIVGQTSSGGSSGSTPPCKNITNRCSNNSDCCTNYCKAKKCALKSSGAPCDFSYNCASNYCNNKKCDCIPLNSFQHECIKGQCCKDGICGPTYTPKALTCCLPFEKKCMSDTDCCSNNCQGNKTCGPPLNCNLSINTNPSLTDDNVGDNNELCKQEIGNLPGEQGSYNQPGKCTKKIINQFYNLIPNNNAVSDGSVGSCGSCSNKPSLIPLNTHCSSGKLYSPKPLPCDGNLYQCVPSPTAPPSCAIQCLDSSTENDCNNMFTKWPECDKNACEWINMYSTTPPSSCSGYNDRGICENIQTKNKCNNMTYMPVTQNPTQNPTQQPLNCDWSRNFAPPFKLNYSCHQCIPDGEQCSSILPSGNTIKPDEQCCSGYCNNNNKCGTQIPKQIR